MMNLQSSIQSFRREGGGAFGNFGKSQKIYQLIFINSLSNTKPYKIS